MFAPSSNPSSSSGTPAPVMHYSVPQHPIIYSTDQYQQMLAQQQGQRPISQSQQPHHQQVQQVYQPPMYQQFPQTPQQVPQHIQQPQSVPPNGLGLQQAPQQQVSQQQQQQALPQQQQQQQQQQQLQNITAQVQDALNVPENKTQMTLELYRRILNFNFVGKYDPKLKQVIHQTPHAVLYKFSQESDTWEKLDYQGPLVFYERNVDDVDQNGNPIRGERFLSNDELKLKDNYWHGLMILNRNNPKNISLGITPKKITSKYVDFYQGNSYDLQIANDLLMLKNCLGDVYGIWIHNVKDRDVFYQFIKYAIDG